MTEPVSKSVSNDSQTLRFAIVGLGKMGIMHATMCHVVPGVEVAALVDVSPGLGAQLHGMGVKSPFFPSLDALLAEGGALDAAIVATPQFAHRSAALACLHRGLHVFCEKPLAHTLEDARAMTEASRERTGLVTAVGFMKGHDPLWREAARRLRQNWIGVPRRFRASVYLSQVFGPKKGWAFSREKAGGGILINSGIHLIHFLRMLFGDAEEVTALACPIHSEVEDTLTALVRFRSGIFGSVDMSWSIPGYPTEGTHVVVEGSEGILDISDDALCTYHLTGSGVAPKGWSQDHRSAFDRAAFNASPDYGGEGFYNEMADFAAAIREGRPALIDWEEGLKAQEMVEALYRSARERRPITLASIGQEGASR